ncbi:hypothetical protein HANVADRAFT_76968 [Hanseniaspora valbyensis NRRL Y-1626]|uniref:DUF1742-domain-containing protein n=1 Tax=Hanseniaspora valbyensis NRRL Y-1626 TaxID=766949 RepID=A0A1B7T9A1_9ASCO|nr:hypothetical protein HANVADRAFT_76968 [Hanseniaspora valbyensis NRRL Y-1626]
MSTDLSLDISNQIYVKRLVKSENEFCMICSYPTKTCLYKKNFLQMNKKTYADWFYICEDHLLNEELLEPKNTKEIKELSDEIEKLNQQIKIKNQEIASEKQTWIDSAMSSTTSYISSKISFTGKKKEEEEKKEKDDDSEENSDIKVDKKTKKQEVTELLDNLAARKEQLVFLRKSIKYFNLTNPTYITRKEAMARSLSKANKKPTTEKTNTKSTSPILNFPSAPTHNPL